jgi:hypothetical protein
MGLDLKTRYEQHAASVDAALVTRPVARRARFFWARTGRVSVTAWRAWPVGVGASRSGEASSGTSQAWNLARRAWRRVEVRVALGAYRAHFVPGQLRLKRRGGTL